MAFGEWNRRALIDFGKAGMSNGRISLRSLFRLRSSRLLGFNIPGLVALKRRLRVGNG